MRKNIIKTHQSTASNIAMLAHFLIVITLLIYGMIVGRTLLLPLIFAVFFTFLLTPLCSFVELLIKNRVIAIMLSFIIVLLPIAGLGVLFGYQILNIVQKMPSIGNTLEKGLENIAALAQNTFSMLPGDMTEMVRQNTENITGSASAFLTTGISSTAGVLTGVVLTVICLFFLLLYRDTIKNFFIYQYRPEKRDHIKDIIDSIKSVIQGYLYGMGTVILILAVLNSVGLWLLGVDYALFWGCLGAFLAIIPYIGTTLGGTLPLLYSLATASSMWQPVGVVILYASIQQLEGNIITPKIVGSNVELNALVAILAMVLFGMIWGVAGIILALPITAVIKVLLEQVPAFQPVSVLLEDHPYDKEDIFAEKYDRPKYRLSRYFKK